MIVACHRLGKTTTKILKFANRKDADLVLKSKKELKDINLLESCSNTDKNQNGGLSSPQTDNNSGNVDVNEENWGGKVYIHQSPCPYYRFLYDQVKEWYNEGHFHNFWVTNRSLIHIKQILRFTYPA